VEKGTRVELIGRIDQQSWGEGENRQYKTVLVANEIMLMVDPYLRIMCSFISNVQVNLRGESSTRCQNEATVSSHIG